MSEVRSSGSTTTRRDDPPSAVVASYVGDSSRALPLGAVPTTLPEPAMLMVYESSDVMKLVES